MVGKKISRYINSRGVARTVVMYRHLKKPVGFTEAHSSEWGVGAGGDGPLPQGGGGHPREIFEK